MPHVCKACGEELGHPEEDLHDPDNVMQIVEGGCSNPDSAHLKAKDGPKGPRMFCAETGQTTKIVEAPPSGSGNPPPNENQNDPEPEGGQQPDQRRTGSSGAVYKDEGDKSANDILFGVASSPVFELNDEQISELMSWSEIYDNQIPPQQVEAVLKNFKGVSKQRANLVRQKYEAKLNRWIQQSSREDTGPSLGSINMQGIPGGGPPNGPSGPPRPPQRGQPQPPQDGDSDETDSGSEEPPEKTRTKGLDSRDRRVARRQEAIDIAANKFADKAAENFAQDAGRILTEGREIAITLFKEKAKRDPEWYFEKLEKWDMDLFDTLMSESEAKKQQDQQQPQQRQQAQVDSELDAALDMMESGGEPEPQQQEPVQEPVEPETTNPEDVFDEDVMDMDEEDHVTDQLVEDDEPEDSADQFSELMGDVEV